MEKDNKKTVTELINTPTISEEVLKGITFSSDDRQFLERQYMGIIEYLKDKLDDNIKFIAEILIDNNNKVFDQFNKIYDTIEKQEERIIVEFKKQTRCLDSVVTKLAKLESNLNSLSIEVKNLGIEIKGVNLEIKQINIQLHDINKRINEHHNRISEIEKILGALGALGSSNNNKK